MDYKKFLWQLQGVLGKAESNLDDLNIKTTKLCIQKARRMVLNQEEIELVLEDTDSLSGDTTPTAKCTVCGADNPKFVSYIEDDVNCDCVYECRDCGHYFSGGL